MSSIGTGSPIAWPSHVRRACGRGGAKRLVVPSAEGDQRGRHRRGFWSEVAAAAWLVLSGYKILERRHRSRLGEIDLIAVKGRRLAFVEVKYRRTFEEAVASISSRQERRIAEAAERWVWQHPRYHGSEIGLDAVLVAPGRLPLHAANALQPTG